MSNSIPYVIRNRLRVTGAPQEPDDAVRLGDMTAALAAAPVFAGYADTIEGNGSDIEFTVTHNLGSDAVMVQVYDADKCLTSCPVEVLSGSSIKLHITPAIESGKKYLVAVVKVPFALSPITPPQDPQTPGEPLLEPPDAQPIWVAPLSVARYGLVGVSVGDYALFAGGVISTFSTGPDTTVDTVDAYDSNLTHTLPTALSAARSGFAGASVGDFALFASGYIPDDWQNPRETPAADVEVYDINLSRHVAAGLSVPRRYLTGATIGGYALFVGGDLTNRAWDDRDSLLGTDIVDAYDVNLTRSTPDALSTKRHGPASVTVGNFVLFASGYERYFVGDESFPQGRHKYLKQEQ